MFRVIPRRKDVIDHVRSRGGMLDIYEQFVEFWKSEGFYVQEVTDESIYLHHGRPDGKVGVQLIRNGLDSVEVIVGAETRAGAENHVQMQFDASTEQKDMIIRAFEAFRAKARAGQQPAEVTDHTMSQQGPSNSPSETGGKDTSSVVKGGIIIAVCAFFLIATIGAIATNSGGDDGGTMAGVVMINFLVWGAGAYWGYAIIRDA